MAKLTREPSIRLSQIQDIAGCRIVVPSIEIQIAAQTMVEEHFFDATRTVDRREQPSHGYRAVHVVVSVRERPVEIQLRTSLQHLWAELCEKLSDKFGGDIKYGGGPDEIRRLLRKSSQNVAKIEELEQNLFKMEAESDMKAEAAQASSRAEIDDFRESVNRARAHLATTLSESIALLHRVRLNRDVH